MTINKKACKEVIELIDKYFVIKEHVPLDFKDEGIVSNAIKSFILVKL